MKLQMSREVDLGKEPVGKLLVILALPAITSQVVNALYNMVDRMYIGHIEGIGADALTGVGVCFPIIMIISAFAYLLGMGGAPRASIYMGKKKNDHAEKILGNCFTALTIVAIALTVLVLLFREPLLYLFGASERTIGYAIEYIDIYAIGTIFVQLTLGMNAFISAQGFSTISMLTVIIGALTNIILDPIFIFVFHMNVSGAAWATILSQALSALWAVRFLMGKQTILRLKKENLKIQWKVLAPCIALGVAPFAMQATESVLVLCFNSSLLNYGGDLAVGAMTILSSIPQRVKKAFQLQTIACFTYSTVMWLAIMLVPSLFIAIFTNDPQLTQISVWALRIYMVGVLLMGLQVSCQQTFIAFGNSKISAFLAVFRKIIVLIPLIYILPHFFSDQVFAVFLAEPIADTIAVLTTLTLFIINFKKLLKHMESEEPDSEAIR